MILTCPECSARYVVDPKALQPAGRNVRCAKCRHNWWVDAPSSDTPTVSEAEDTVNIQEETPPKPDSKPEETETAKPAAEDFQDMDLPINRRKKRPRPIPKGSNLPALQNHRHGSSKWGWISLVVFLFVLIGGLMMFREPLSDAWPPIKKLYKTIGLDGAGDKGQKKPEKVEKKIPITERLVIKNLKPSQELINNTPHLVIEGEVQNIADNNQKVPTLKASLQDRNRVTIREWTFEAEKSTVAKDRSVTFKTSLPNPPADAVDLRVVLQE